MLGLWWLTLQMVILIVGISVVFGQLLDTDLRSFLPYVGLGFIAFSLLSGLTSTAAVVFIAGSSTLKSTRQPLSNLVLRDVGVEFINFAHNMVIYLVFLVIGLVPLTPKIPIALLMVVVIAANGLFLGLWLGIAVARFRDLQPFVTSILGVAIFFCPVFYDLDSLSSGIRNVLLVWNPFTYLIMAFRTPLLGEPLLWSYYVGSAIVTMLNVAVGLRSSCGLGPASVLGGVMAHVSLRNVRATYELLSVLDYNLKVGWSRRFGGSRHPPGDDRRPQRYPPRSTGRLAARAGGANGAGKSTLLAIMAGVLPPTSGQRRGARSRARPARRRVRVSTRRRRVETTS